MPIPFGSRLPSAMCSHPLHTRRKYTLRQHNIGYHLRCSCLCALSSAILLSILYSDPDYWYLSLIALAPFLFGLLRTNLNGSLCLASMLATFFVLLTGRYDSILSLKLLIARLLWFNLAFLFFATAVNRIRNATGFSPVVVALLWLTMELFLAGLTDLRPVFLQSLLGRKMFLTFCSIFGIMLLPFTIVLINAALLWLLQSIGRKTTRDYETVASPANISSGCPPAILPDRYLYYELGPRAPPIISTCTS